jgi:heptosyltransferase-2
MNATRAPKRILLIRTDRLGETLLNLPLPVVLKRAFPEAVLTWMVHEELAELLCDSPGVDRVIAYQEAHLKPWWRRAIRLAGWLRREGFELAVISNPKKEFHVATWLAGTPIRVGYDHKWSWALTHRVTDHKTLGARHEVEYNLELLRALGILPPPVPSVQFPVRAEEESAMSQLLGNLSVKDTHRLVALHPWTSNPKKQWPMPRFRELIQRLQTSSPRPFEKGRGSQVMVALIGGSDEQAKATDLLRAGESGALDLVGRLSLRQLAALFRRVRVLVSNDSGPVHLAAAVGTPTVALFGTTDPATSPTRWGPWGQSHTVIWKRTMDEISVEEVALAVQRYLE